MSRSLLFAAGAASLALLTAAPAQAATVQSATTQPSCVSGLQAGLATTVCATVSGGTVSVTGQIALAGPPSDPTGTGPGGGLPTQQLDTRLAADVVGGANLATSQQGVLFTASTVELGPLDAAAPCGSTVRASFAVASYPWVSAPVTVDVPVSC